MNRGVYGWSQGHGSGSTGLTLIDSRQLVAIAANVQFTAIPGSYKALKVLWQARTDAAVNNTQVQVQFNGDTASNYDTAYNVSFNNGGENDSYAGITAARVGNLTGANGASGCAGSGEFTIVNYAGTTFRKGLVGINQWRNEDVSFPQFSLRTGAEWRSTAAITSMLLFPASGNFVIGSIFYLWGLL